MPKSAQKLYKQQAPERDAKQVEKSPNSEPKENEPPAKMYKKTKFGKVMIFGGANQDPPRRDPPTQNPRRTNPGFGKLQMAICTLSRAVPPVGGQDILVV